MKVNRIEQHQINNNHNMYAIIDGLCFKSKNLYNYANYMIRQEFINNGRWLRHNEIDKIIQSHEPYKELGSQASQKTLQLLDRNWKSFFVAIKDYGKNPSKYLGRPKMPKYKDKDGRSIVMIKNIQFKIKDGYVIFSWKPLRIFKIKTNIKGRPLQIRFVPYGNIYKMEIVYEIEIPEDIQESSSVIGIDLGINNLATLTNNIGVKPIIINGKILKSINQYYNKQIAHYKSILKKVNDKDYSLRLYKMTLKRNNKIKNYLHKASKEIIRYCVDNNIDTIIIGYNKQWKSSCNIGDSNNQKFVMIPHNFFVNIITYKAEDVGIKVIRTEESYTSGTSFIDNEEPCEESYNKSRRIKRGLFKSNEGILINSDVNGSFQIIKKVFPNAFGNGIEGVDLHPVVVDC